MDVSLLAIVVGSLGGLSGLGAFIKIFTDQRSRKVTDENTKANTESIAVNTVGAAMDKLLTDYSRLEREHDQMVAEQSWFRLALNEAYDRIWEDQQKFRELGADREPFIPTPPPTSAERD